MIEMDTAIIEDFELEFGTLIILSSDDCMQFMSGVVTVVEDAIVYSDDVVLVKINADAIFGMHERGSLVYEHSEVFVGFWKSWEMLK